MVCTWSGKPICWPHLSEVSLVLPLKWSQGWSGDGLLILSKKIVESFLFLCLCQQGDQWCGAVDSVLSSTVLQIFQNASHLWWVMLPTSLSSHFPRLLTCPGQFNHRSLQKWISGTGTCQVGLPIPLFVENSYYYTRTKLNELFVSAALSYWLNWLMCPRRLIQFGLLKGLIRRIQKYPVKLPNESSTDVSPRLQPISKWLGGNHSYDEISCKTGRL